MSLLSDLTPENDRRPSLEFLDLSETKYVEFPCLDFHQFLYLQGKKAH